MVKKFKKNIKLYNDDIPKNLNLGTSIAIDTETMGLNINNDRLCLLQISTVDGDCHLIKFSKGNYNAPNLIKILKNKSILKIFHFARFDVAILKHTYNISVKNIIHLDMLKTSFILL